MMKAALAVAGAIAMLMSGNGCSTEGTEGSGGAGVVTVQYVRPENFTDFSVQGRRDTQSSAAIFTREVTGALEPVMNRRFPGDRLTLRFTNIDLAGRSTVGPRSVRVVRNRTAARLWFDYLLRDKSGRSATSGSQTLVDNSSVSGRTSSGSLSPETRMLQRWLERLSVNR
jgi:Protein of unknown function (DUF3016)